MSVKLERESQEREEAMQQIRENEAKLNEAKARVSKVLRVYRNSYALSKVSWYAPSYFLF